MNYGREILPGAYELTSGPLLPVSLMGLSESELTALAAEGTPTTKRKTMDEKTSGMVRHVLNSTGMLLVMMGWVDETTMMTVVGAMMTLLAFGWSWMSK